MTEERSAKPARRRALVVGGSGGIGGAICRALSSPDLHITIHGGHDEEKLRRLGDTLRDQGCSTSVVCRNIITADDGLAVLSRSEPLDILVVSYGPFEEAPLAGAPADHFRRMVELNYVLPAALIAGVLPGMRSRGYGRIVVFGTSFGDRIKGFRRSAGYAAAKMGLASLVKSTALQGADANVFCNMICPGYVATEYHTQASVERYSERMPGGRAQTPDEIAALARWLLSENNRAVNGAIVTADRGL